MESRAGSHAVLDTPTDGVQLSDEDPRKNLGLFPPGTVGEQCEQLQVYVKDFITLGDETSGDDCSYLPIDPGIVTPFSWSDWFCGG